MSIEEDRRMMCEDNGMAKLCEESPEYLTQVPLGITHDLNFSIHSRAILPITIQTIHSFEQSKIPKLYGYTPMLRVIGILNKIEENNHHLIYHIKDDTGSIKAINWRYKQRRIRESITLDINQYVTVVGLIRTFKERKCIHVLNISYETTLNELTSHWLDMLYAAIKPIGVQQSRRARAVNEDGQQYEDTNVAFNPRYNSIVSLPEDYQPIYDIVQRESSIALDVHRVRIMELTPSELVEELDDILDYLLYHGFIRTTRTANHFRFT